MTEDNIVRNMGGAWISNDSVEDDKPHPALRRLWVRKVMDGDTRESFLYFGRPFPMGSTIGRADLVLEAGVAINGTLKISLVSGRWKARKVTWNDQPPTIALNSVSQAINIAAGATATVNIAAMLQSVSNAAADWYGIKLEMTGNGTGGWFRGVSSKPAENRPYLDIEWTEPADAPVNLSPDGATVSTNKPILSGQYWDEDGTGGVSAVKVLLSSDEEMSSILFDSGWVSATSPELDLAATAYTGLPSGSPRYWTMQVQDETGRATDVSEVASVTYVANAALEMTSPGTADRATQLFDNQSFETTENFVAVSGSDEPVRSDVRAYNGTWSVYFRKGSGTSILYGSRTITSLLTRGAGTYTLDLRQWIPASVTGANQGVRIGGAGTTNVDSVTSVRDAWHKHVLSFVWDGVGAVTLYAKSHDASTAAESWIDWVNLVYGPDVYTPSAPREFRESTPTVGWNLTGVQTAYHVELIDPVGKAGKKIVRDSGKTSSATEAWSFPDPQDEKGLLKVKENKDYTLRIKSWDDKFRAPNGSAKDYSVVEETVRFDYRSNTTSPVTGFTVSQVLPWHWTKLQFSTSTLPDKFEIWANDEMIERIDSTDVTSEGGTTYSYVCRLGPPRTSITWKIVRVVNGRGSTNNPTAVTNYKANSAVLSEVDGSNAVMFLNYSVTAGTAKEQTVHEVIGNFPPILINQAVRGQEGSFQGTLAGEAVSTMTIEQEKAAIEALLSDEGKEVILSYVDEAFKCFLVGSQIQTRVDKKGPLYDVSFNFHQTDF